ncbi:MAG TPA: SDR family oxidoreductase [Sphingomonas sp.]|nr:SDR family oxidoreductase [Sphingomonas sp.]
MARPRNVIVTGGGRRLGAAIVRRLAARGHRVVIHHHRSADEAAALADAIGPGAAAIAADLADHDGLGALIEASRAALGGAIDGLVNSASLFEFDTPPLASGALFERLARVNVTAPVLLASALARQDDLEDGAIVNILDQKLANLNPDFFSYTLTKAALETATMMLAQSLAPRVRVNAVAPGLTLPSLDQTKEEFAAVSRENLLRRPIGAEAIGDAVAYLLDAPSVTGQTLFVDNGQRFLPRTGDVMFATRGEDAP